MKPTTIVKNGRALASIHHVCQVFEEETTGHSHFNRHRFPSFGKNFYTVVNVIDEEKVFVKISGRKYPSFSLDKGLFESQSLDELKKVKSSIEGLLYTHALQLYRTRALLGACAYIPTGRECALISELRLETSTAYTRIHIIL